jgi:hypothetical protein
LKQAHRLGLPEDTFNLFLSKYGKDLTKQLLDLSMRSMAAYALIGTTSQLPLPKELLDKISKASPVRTSKTTYDVIERDEYQKITLVVVIDKIVPFDWLKRNYEDDLNDYIKNLKEAGFKINIFEIDWVHPLTSEIRSIHKCTLKYLD